MLNLAVKTIYMNEIHFHMIPSKKFKTVNIVVKCKAPLHENTITKRALLPYILQKGTLAYPSEKQLKLKLDELYGAILSIDSTKKGNDHIISFRLEVANEKFIEHETTVVNEALQLLREVIFNPHVEGNAFVDKVITREKLTLENKIKSIHDDKLAYANMRLIDEMCKGEVYRLHPFGYIEDLQKITAAQMYAYYQSLLVEDRIDFYITGDFHVEKIEKKLTKIFRRSANEAQQLAIDERKRRIEVPREIVEVQSVQQAKLHIGYRTNSTYKDDDYFALQIFNGLFGSFPSSKLFKNVREKHSLAYYASSRIESHKGLLIVFSGIESENYQQAKEIIDTQMKAMQEGEFTDFEVTETKELIISEIYKTLDNPQGIIEVLYQQVVGERDLSPQTFIERIKLVTKEDIVRIAKKIELDTIYLLTNESGGETNE